MARQAGDAEAILIIAAIVFAYLYYSKRKAAPLISNTKGCGCGSKSQGWTAPRNSSASNKGSSPVLSGGVTSTASGDNAPPSTPGSNSGAAGSGGNWGGVSTHRMTPLTPSSAPSSPTLAAGNKVWIAHSNPATVHG